MAEKTKNLCAQIPESLHDIVRTHQQESGKILSEYITELLTNYYENLKGMTNMENTRTLAVQLDAELFDQLDDYLKKNKLKKRSFITNLIHAGVDPKTVQYLAGHENSKVTMDIYAKVKYNKPEQLSSVVNKALKMPSSDRGEEHEES